MMIPFPSKNDILLAMKNDVFYKSQALIGGTIFKNGSWVNRHTGGYAMVFPFTTADGQKIVVRCWFFDIGNSKKRMLAIMTELTKLNCPYFVNLVYHDDALLINGVLQPVVTMDYVEDPTLKDYIKENINDRSAILKVAENFRLMVQFFHQNNIAHGDLSHGNIKVKNDGSLVVIDYDSMYVQELNGMPDIIKGLSGYQHPARHDNNNINPKLDYFSELVIYLSLLVFADYKIMWEEYCETEDLLFSKQDYESPSTSKLFAQLTKSTNLQISDLTTKLVDCLNYNDICHLKPLEEMLKNKLDDLANSIIDKF
ncbi:MAG: RIO1 family regulatory kinase/ATPase [Bacteroidota bacterium]|nr:RIO1 family regulatory kinase/ATPase [Bacteroidota bacterium]